MIVALPEHITPAFIKRRADTERWSIDRFIYDVAIPNIKPTDRVLDAGAGPQPFKKALLFARYESTDFEDVFAKFSKGTHDFVCSLDDIPKKDSTYDVIINTQVLEHVEHPQKVMDELYRVLKPGGYLFLTTDQMFWVHHSPYNFYFFTRYGLRSLFEHAGFEVKLLQPRGGALWFIAKLFNYLPSYLFYQIAYTGYKKDESFTPEIRSYSLAIVLLPFYVISRCIFGFLVPWALFYLDPLDRQKDITLGYQCWCVKPSS